MSAKLFVGNLSFQATEEDLRELFAQAGNVETVRIITDQFTGRPRGFGFVEMATKEEAQKAVEMLNGRLFRDRNLVVDEARWRRRWWRWSSGRPRAAVERGWRRLAPLAPWSEPGGDVPGSLHPLEAASQPVRSKYQKRES
jgi:cold-inducible RNA-binding protein